MKLAAHVATREIKIGFRNPWAYSFAVLFALFMLCLLLIYAQDNVAGYSSTTGMTLNLIAYLLPLMTLMLGSFSLTGEKEDGNWELLATYALPTWALLIGKYAGLAVVLLTILCIGFGLAAVVGWVIGGGFEWATYVQLLCFSVSIALTFLAIAVLVGTLSRNRWQALTVAVAVWFFTIVAWPPLLIAVLGTMPYLWVKPAVTALTFLNPAELARLFTVVKLGAGSTLGPEYYEWVNWIRRSSGSVLYAGVLVLWVGCTTGLACLLWERGRTRV